LATESNFETEICQVKHPLSAYILLFISIQDTLNDPIQQQKMKINLYNLLYKLSEQNDG